ncbi:MAG: hypothetical protein HOE71_07160 [Lentimicrobiaceae bacterium]|nr:hypothetical protein [Lentimicrobiaceae bacterium]MBT4190923.1 hypothetical protein [Lentimicrobiaceae bacterium]MBT4468326.1 hypothetical protein [Lentimicrobiaceae bacterium]MBT5163730.1 hypothetical protein [Lentimicrobiaceae bacterium]MBT5733015.1 hypothetical protein [Lentimicrobiaceae bacterium]
MRKLLSYLLLLFVTTGCLNNMNNNDSKILARVHDKYLYIDDLQGLFPKNMSPRDSISTVRGYVNEWVRTNVMIYQAEMNLPLDQLDFTKQLDDYRNSLIIYNYETSLINQNLDTIVSEDEIYDYYNSHLSDFELKENISKALYVITDNSDEKEEIFDHLFTLADSLLFDSIEYYAPSYALSYSLDTSKWVTFFDIQKTIPIETYNIELFLKNNRMVKINTERLIYYIKFFDFRIKDDISPLDFERKDIYNIIISKRKIKLAKEVRNDIYERAIINKDFEIYYNN